MEPSLLCGSTRSTLQRCVRQLSCSLHVAGPPDTQCSLSLMLGVYPRQASPSCGHHPQLVYAQSINSAADHCQSLYIGAARRWRVCWLLAWLACVVLMTLTYVRDLACAATQAAIWYMTAVAMLCSTELQLEGLLASRSCVTNLISSKSRKTRHWGGSRCCTEAH